MKPQVPEGLDVQYAHARIYDARTHTMLPCGGWTVAMLHRKEDRDDIVAVGNAYCAPSDNYNKRIGRNIALGRALKQLAGGECG